MCVRALDYCPPVDLTFGEYLRAIMTADVDTVPDDDRGYRVAFIEAFRRRGLYPRDVRTLSVENLVWRGPRFDDRAHSAGLVKLLKDLRDPGYKQLDARSREEIFHASRALRGRLHGRLARHFKSGSEGAQDALFLGLDGPDHPFEVHSVHFARRVGPDGDVLLQAILQITQRLQVPRGHDPTRQMSFEGGCTLIANLRQPGVAYCVRKPVGSVTRRARQQEFLDRFGAGTLRRTYLGATDPADVREPFAMLHRGGV